MLCLAIYTYCSVPPLLGYQNNGSHYSWFGFSIQITAALLLQYLHQHGMRSGAQGRKHPKFADSNSNEILVFART